MEFLKEELKNISSVKQIVADVKDGLLPISVFGLPDLSRAAFSLVLSECTDKKIVVLTSTEAEAVRFAEEFTALGKRAVLIPARDYNLLHTTSFSREYEQRKIAALWQILKGEFDGIFLDIEALTQKTIAPSTLQSLALTVKVGDTLDSDTFFSDLLESGYERTEQVEGVGQFSVRGNIIDLYSPNFAFPVRIELWGDEIDSISSFSPTTQRRMENLDEFCLLPAVEFAIGTDNFIAILEKIHSGKKVSDEFKNTVEKDIDALKSGLSVSADRYMEHLKETPVFVWEYFKELLLFVNDNTNITARIKSLDEARKAEVSDLVQSGSCDKTCEKFWAFKNDIIKGLEGLNLIYLDSFTKSGYQVPPKAIYNVFIKQLTPWSGSIDLLYEDLVPAIQRKQKIVILAGSEKGAKILVSQLEVNNIKAQYALPSEKIENGGVYVMPASFTAGMEIEERNLLVIAHKSPAVSKNKKKKSKAEGFSSLEELKVGDYVVHFAHGIGQFDGIHRIEAGGVTKDYIKIKYKGSDVLYLPVTQLDLVSRYIGGAGENGPVLHRLGSADWQKTKARVKSAVKNIAKEIIKLYAERQEIKGYAFSPDGELQRDFEARFPFEETDDQLKAAYEIKRDMEQSVPMDRLLCGDVGFGKTEVALRAAFKCICDGKQCALLVPTTILAWQHFLTATERFGNLPIRVEMLSRFKTKGEIAKTVKALKSGEVDMVIGTHRLLSDDIKFRDLGLLIVDEEQRFGVAQKEKLKTSFTNVDVLTLTATPIPRTLNMAMSGIRDMSSIEEAPQDRQPVQTYVLEQNSGVLLEAIRKELRRGGQVYYMHNKVESITHCAARLKTALPEANIGIAHGKMSEEELSKVWKELLEGEIDILVCTTIIETGVDVPNANTLIIEDADRMGLAQLHQIRGRVGRSNRRSYAYFCFKRGKALSEIATKRLEAIREYTAFGSGFKIAMRDLEIRGAGNILGGEQHGHMESVGYDMYIKLLAEAVSEEKGEISKPAYSECTVDLDINASIPEKYVPFLSHRLEMYRKIADIKSKDDKWDVIDELCDRFGDPPKEVLGLIDIALVRGAAERYGIKEINGNKNEIRLYPMEFSPTLAKELTEKLGSDIKIVTSEPIHFSVKIPPKKSGADILKELAEKM